MTEERTAVNANRPRRTGVLIALAAAAGLAGALPASASAASSFTCEASAVRAQVLVAPAIEPIVANRGQACKRVIAGVPTIAGLPVPATVRVLSAQTDLQGSDAKPGSQKAAAAAGLADLSVGLPPLPITLPVDQVPQTTIPNPVPGGTPIDITALLKSLAPNGALPTELIGARGAFSTATASCVNGATRLDGFSQVAGLRVLGRELPTDQVVSQALNVVGGGTIDPSQISVSSITNQVPGLQNLPIATIEKPIKDALAALPKITIPAAVAQLTITPAEQVREGTKLTQRALRVNLKIAGQQIADLALGEASVSAANVMCTAGAVAAEQLSCTTKRLALVDVLRQGRRVKLFGVADRALVGKQVQIRFTADRRIVARPVVRRDGSFSATAPLPKASIRNTNRARYQATIGREKSIELKLVRRMVVSQLTSANGKVTIAGRVIRPLGSPVQTIVVSRRVSCKRSEVVARIKPSRTGAFRVTVDAPPKTLAATYRLATKVRKFASNPKLFPTYTLPRAVEVQ